MNNRPYLTTTTDATRRRMALAMGTRGPRRNRYRTRRPTVRMTVWSAIVAALCGAAIAWYFGPI